MNEYDYLGKYEDIHADISSLDFSIPPEIFIAFDSLTEFAGYFMPLRLYLPIITLILAYWFIMITTNIFKMSVSFIGSFSSFLSKFIK